MPFRHERVQERKTTNEEKKSGKCPALAVGVLCICVYLCAFVCVCVCVCDCVQFKNVLHVAILYL